MRVTANHATCRTATLTTFAGDSFRVARGSTKPGGLGGLLARSNGYSAGNWSTHNFYHADGNGNVTYLVNSSQTRSASYRYDPYGNALIVSELLSYLGGIPNTCCFSSKEVHLLTGLYYYGYRWYAPNLQRWLDRDPIGERGGVNLYGYVRNSPTTSVDPRGLLVETLPETLPEIEIIVDETGPIGWVIGGAVLDVGLIGADLYLLNQVNQLNQQNQQAQRTCYQKAQEYERYKNRCKEPPPPRLDPCAEARWKLQRNKDCKQLRGDFANKWFGGNYDPGHSRVIQELDRAIQKLEDWIKENCP